MSTPHLPPAGRGADNPTMTTLTPCLWFDTEAQEAANFYISVLPDSRITDVTHYGEAGPRPADMVLTVEFEQDGNPFTALNGGPEFRFSEAVRFKSTASIRLRWTDTGRL